MLPALRKEVHYFDYPTRYRWGRWWYRAHFPRTKRRRESERRLGATVLTGEASPYYGFHPLAVPRIAAALPRVKLIALLRDPVRRAYSHYHHERRLGYETVSFEEAIELEDERTAGEAERIREDPSYYSYAHQHWSYLARGRYLEQIEAWIRSIPGDRLHLVVQEELRAEPDETLDRVLDFLGLPACQLSKSEVPASDYSPLEPDLHRRLAEQFAASNERLFRYLGRDLDWS